MEIFNKRASRPSEDLENFLFMYNGDLHVAVTKRFLLNRLGTPTRNDATNLMELLSNSSGVAKLDKLNVQTLKRFGLVNEHAHSPSFRTF